MSVIPLRIEGQIEKELRRVARELNRSRSWVIKEAIREYIEETFDYAVSVARMKDKNDEILTSSEFRAKYLRGK